MPTKPLEKRIDLRNKVLLLDKNFLGGSSFFSSFFYDDESPTTIKDGVATIFITGLITGDNTIANDYCTGTFYIRTEIEAAIENPEVNEIILRINSPGGDSNGIDALNEYIHSAKDIKDIKAHGVGTVASAAYYIASACSKIEMDADGDFAGSIGAYVIYIDDSKYLDDMGVQEIVIIDDSSPEKYPDATTPEGYAVLKNNVNEVKRIFVEKVSRSGRIKDVAKATNGAIFAADKALELGLIDSIKYHNKKKEVAMTDEEKEEFDKLKKENEELKKENEETKNSLEELKTELNDLKTNKPTEEGSDENGDGENGQSNEPSTQNSSNEETSASYNPDVLIAWASKNNISDAEVIKAVASKMSLEDFQKANPSKKIASPFAAVNLVNKAKEQRANAQAKGSTIPKGSVLNKFKK